MIESPAPADAALTFTVLENEKRLADKGCKQLLTSDTPSKRISAEKRVNDCILQLYSFSCLDYGQGRQMGHVAVHSGFRQSGSRWVLDWGLVAIAPTSTILSPENRELLNKVRGDM